MNSCSQVQEEVLAGSGLLHDLPKDMAAHVEGCEACADFAHQRRRLRRLAKTTQEIIQRDIPLEPKARSRIKRRVQELSQAPERAAASFFRWFPVVAIPILLIVFGWSLTLGDSSGGAVGPPLEPSAAPIAHVSPPARLKTVAGNFKTRQTHEGGTLETAETEAAVQLAEGHRIRLDRLSRVKMTRLVRNQLSFQVTQGAAHFQVRKLVQGARFDVMAGDLRVQVVGTRFTVGLDEAGRGYVDVTEGVVTAFTHGDPATRLEAGDRHPARPATNPAEHDGGGERPSTDSDKKPKPQLAKAAPASPTRSAPAGKRKPARLKPVDVAPEPQVIEVNVPAQSMGVEHATRGAQARLVGAVGLIRRGGCVAALGDLRSISRDLKDLRNPSDLLYLMGYCLRKIGKFDRAEKLFRAYRKMSKHRTWRLPATRTEVLPLPSLSNLDP